MGMSSTEAGTDLLSVAVQGGGPVALAFATSLADLTLDIHPRIPVKIVVHDHRWHHSPTSGKVEWKEFEEQENRGHHVVTLQSNVWGRAPLHVQDAIFRCKGEDYDELWPRRPDSHLFPRNVQLRTVEDRLLTLAQTDRYKHTIALEPRHFALEEASGHHFVVLAECGAPHLSREVFGLDTLPCTPQSREDILGVCFQDAGSSFSALHAMLLTISQNRFMVNTLGLRSGFLYMRLTKNENKEFVGLDKNDDMVRWDENQPFLFKRVGKSYVCSRNGTTTTLKPPRDPLSKLWPRVLEGFKLFGIPEDCVRSITKIHVQLHQWPCFQTELANFATPSPSAAMPHPWAFIMGDLVTPLPWGGGLNLGIKSALSLAQCLHGVWVQGAPTPNNPFCPNLLTQHIGLMHMLQFQQGQLTLRLTTNRAGGEPTPLETRILEGIRRSREGGRPPKRSMKEKLKQTWWKVSQRVPTIADSGEFERVSKLRLGMFEQLDRLIDAVDHETSHVIDSTGMQVAMVEVTLEANVPMYPEDARIKELEEQIQRLRASLAGSRVKTPARAPAPQPAKGGGAVAEGRALAASMAAAQQASFVSEAESVDSSRRAQPWVPTVPQPATSVVATSSDGDRPAAAEAAQQAGSAGEARNGASTAMVIPNGEAAKRDDAPKVAPPAVSSGDATKDENKPVAAGAFQQAKEKRSSWLETPESKPSTPAAVQQVKMGDSVPAPAAAAMQQTAAPASETRAEESPPATGAASAALPHAPSAGEVRAPDIGPLATPVVQRAPLSSDAALSAKAADVPRRPEVSASFGISSSLPSFATSSVSSRITSITPATQTLTMAATSPMQTDSRQPGSACTAGDDPPSSTTPPAAQLPAPADAPGTAAIISSAVQRGDLATLVRHLHSEATSECVQVAIQLRRMAAGHGPVKGRICNQFGALDGLALLLHKGDTRAKELAAEVFAELAKRNPEGSVVSSLDDSREAKEIQQKICATEGVLPGLASLLQSGHCVRAQEQAAETLRWLIWYNRDNQLLICAHDGILEGLVNLLKTGNPGAQEQAAAALGALAWSNSTNRKRICTHGQALGGLTQLLHKGSSGAQQEAARAFIELAWSSAESQRMIMAKEGTLAGLSRVLVEGTPAGQEAAATVLVWLADLDNGKDAIRRAGGHSAAVRLGSGWAGQLDPEGSERARVAAEKLVLKLS